MPRFRSERRSTPRPRPRVLLTGATGGLGPRIAGALAQRGADLALSALPDPVLDQLATRLGPAAVAFPADLRDPEAPARIVAAARRVHGGIDVLVHNAGVERIGAYAGQPLSALDEVVRVNLLSAMHLSRLLLPGMVERGYGRLVYVSSMAGKTGPACAGAYAASKAGLIALARSLRAEHRGTGVTASVVVPGFVRDEGMYERGRREAGFHGSFLLGTTTADAVARAVVRAVDGDEPELVVQRGPARLVVALVELFPRRIGQRVNRWVGADRIFTAWAAARAGGRSGGEVDVVEDQGREERP